MDLLKGSTYLECMVLLEVINIGGGLKEKVLSLLHVLTFCGEYIHSVDALLLPCFAYITTQLLPK